MKLTQFALTGCLLAAAGCAAPRGNAGAGGSMGNGPVLTPTPETNLGEPSNSFGGQGTEGSGATLFKGGPSFRRMPEAWRDDSGRSSRLSSRWSFGPPLFRNGGTGAGPAATPASAFDRPVLLEAPTWLRFYRSTQRRPIETLQLGNGRQRIAFLSSLHGDEAQSVAVVEELARYLKGHPESLRNATVLIVRTPNPDGFDVRSPYNVNGVDLNRNFPSDNWADLANTRSGPSAGSEAETRSLVRMLGDFRPTLLVHLKDSRGKAIVNGEGNIQKQAEKVADLVHGQPRMGLGARTSGSVENYALTRLKCPSLTLLLAHEPHADQAWEKNSPALFYLLGVNSTPKATSTDSDEGHPFDQPTIQNSSHRSTRPDRAASSGTRNQAETRPARSQRTLPDFQSAIPDHGYVELPSP
ncbi:MAG: DUF2817 domain-containing protein [Planctomycetales bacterium]